MRNGLTVFLDALRLVLSAPGTALRIVAGPSLVRLALEVLIELGFNPEAPLATVLVTLADVAFVAMVAVGWHRFRLLDEAPGLIGPRPTPGRMAKYGVEWVVLGIFVAILLVLIFLPVIAFEYCCLPAGTLTRWLVGQEFVFDQFSVAGLLVSALCIWLFTWLFFRLALGLPHLAVRAPREKRLASWALTARLEPAVLVCAVLAMIGTLLLWGPAFWAYDLLPETWIFGHIPSEGSYDPYRYSVGYLALIQLCFTLQVIFGAAILTELYRDAKAAAEIPAG